MPGLAGQNPIVQATGLMAKRAEAQVVREEARNWAKQEMDAKQESELLGRQLDVQGQLLDAYGSDSPQGRKVLHSMASMVGVELPGGQEVEFSQYISALSKLKKKKSTDPSSPELAKSIMADMYTRFPRRAKQIGEMEERQAEEQEASNVQQALDIRQLAGGGELTPEQQAEAGLPSAERGLLARGGATGQELLKGQEGAGRQFAPETKYIPIGGGRFQLMSVDVTTGGTTPVQRQGKDVILSEKEVLIAEGKKAQSLINPYETKLLAELGKSEGTRLTELRTVAQDGISNIAIIAEARQLLDRGIYTGSAANIKKGFDKYLQEANIFIGGRKAANTEAYASMMGLAVGKIIKQFGAGTGLSDADREYAEKIVGGRVTLTEDAIRQLLDINERMARFGIKEYNAQAQRAREDIETKEYLRPLDVPGQQQAAPAAGAPPINLLQEGQDTEFDNGQVWSLRGGRPIQVR